MFSPWLIAWSGLELRLGGADYRSKVQYLADSDLNKIESLSDASPTNEFERNEAIQSSMRIP